VAGAFVPAASAAAGTAQLHNGRTLSFRPLRSVSEAVLPADRFFTNLDYNGGPVMPSNTNYLVYWAPAGSPAYPAGFKSGVDRYFEDLAHDSGGTQNVDSVSAQYNDAAGEFANYQSTYGGALPDTTPYPKNGCKAAARCLTDKQIQEELTRFVKEQKLPTDLTHEYFLLTPPGVESCFEASGGECSAGSKEPWYCAYHGNIPLAGGGELIYANDPYVAGIVGCDEGISPNESPSDGELEGGLSHEHNESLTDPEPNNAWTDLGAETGEIGDKCEGLTGTPLGKAPDGQDYNQVINGHFYWYQEEWSNQGHSCQQRLAFSGERPQPRFSASAGSGTEVHLQAGLSNAPGGVFRYDWQLDDPQEGKTLESTSPTLTHTFSAAGIYTVALTVFSANGTSAGTACKLTVPLVDESPAAAFTAPAGVLAPGSSVPFDGSASTDEDGSIVAYVWSFGDGTAPVIGAKPSHVFAADGTYDVKLSVIDSGCMGASVTHAVHVDEPPTASIAVSAPPTPVAESPISFEGAGSADPDGEIKTYAWSFGDGGESSEANPAHTYSAPGSYEVTLKVTDSEGRTATATRTVAVGEADELPTAAIEVGSPVALAGVPVSFNGNASSDPDGEITSWSWRFGDGGESSEANPAHTYAAAGTYEVTLTVFDSAGLGQTTTHKIVIEADEPPTAEFTTLGSATAGEPLSFDASASSDPDGEIKSWSWHFGDGGESSEASPTHTYAAPGSYEASLTVTDSAGHTATVTHMILVEPDEPPAAAFTVLGGTPPAGSPVSFDAGASSDPDGSIASYAWSFGDGTSAAAGITPSHVFAAAGDYEVTLTVTDSSGRTASVTRLLAVGPATGGISSGPFGGGGIGPSPAVSAGVTGVLSLVSSTLRVHSGRAAARLTCAGNSPSCTGWLQLSLHRRVRVLGHLRTRLLILASSTFAFAPGGAKTVVLTLTRAGRAQLTAERGRLVAVLRIGRTSPAPPLTHALVVRLLGR
jgi:PKD repeat protein